MPRVSDTLEIAACIEEAVVMLKSWLSSLTRCIVRSADARLCATVSESCPLAATAITELAYPVWLKSFFCGFLRDVYVPVRA